jgi:hypothetical protein
MTQLGLNHWLTKPEGEEVFRQRYDTHEGMAFWSGTGPQGTTCRQCKHWSHRRRWERDKGLVPGGPAPATCRKFRSLAMKNRGTRIPHDAPSCKYFDATENPQALRRPGGE